MIKYKRYERYKDSGVEWIGEIPEHWELRKIKHIGMLSAGGVNKKIEEGEELFKSVHYMDVYRNSGKAIGNDDDYLVVSATQSQAKNCTLRKGDVLFTSSSETPDDIGHAVVISEDLEQTLYGYHLIRLRLDRDIPADYSYRKYMFNNHYIRSYFSSRTQGITRYGLKYDDYKEAVVFIPPISEQKTIANFLDQKTAEIDGLIADKEKLIELLQEKRQAVITEAVTKGLNPNVRLKDSGIEWIGEIPEHWGVEPIKYLVKTIQTGTTPTTKNDDYFDGDIQWFTPGDFQGSKELYESSRKISNRAIIDNEARLFPKNTVMIVGIGATVGKVAKLGIEGSFNQQITGLIVNEQRLNCDYLYYWLYINQETIKNISNYTTLPIINNEFVKNFECLSLPLDEQQAIVNYLNQKTSEIDDLILKIRLQIQKLKEYRQSLISEAVTGKIDVREFGSISEVI